MKKRIHEVESWMIARVLAAKEHPRVPRPLRERFGWWIVGVGAAIPLLHPVGHVVARWFGVPCP